MSVLYQYYPCNPTWASIFPDNDTRGVTTWNENNNTTYGDIAPNGTRTITFTATVPKCYSYPHGDMTDFTGTHPRYGRDSCNLTFEAHTTEQTTGTPELKFSLNGVDLTYTYLSGEISRGGTQTFELGNVAIYNDIGSNTFTFTNTGSKTIRLDDFRIYRTYKLCSLNACMGGSCPTYYQGIGCHGGTLTGTSGNLDYTRIDKPCNCAACGGLGHVNIHDTSLHANTITANGGSLSWAFTFSTSIDYGTYLGKSICLFNFNGISPCTDETAYSDVRMVAYLNGTSIATYYLNKHQGKGMFPSCDLAKIPGTIYNDIGSNTMTLVNYGSVNVKMTEDIDIYRIYRTSSIDNCSPCTSGCQVSCQQCNTSCYVCQEGCQYSCQDCQGAGCQSGCQGCQYRCYTCEESCYYCQSECDTSCQICQPCEGCQSGGCQTCNCDICMWCQPCQSCMPCETCYTCASCMWECYNACYEGTYGP